MKSVRSIRAVGVVLCWLLLALALSCCTSSPEVKSARFIEAGKKLMESKDTSRAILAFRNAVGVTPKNAEAYYQLGLACLAAGDLRTAVVSLRKATELNPKHAAAQLRLAQLMAGVSDPGVLKDAQQRLQALLQDSSDNPEALHALALTELKLGDAAEAMRHLNLAIAAAPQEVMIAVTLAQARLAQKDPRGAEAVLVKACENSPKSADAVVILGQFYLSQNRTTEAGQQFERALAMSPDNSGALLNLAMLQYQTGRKQDAEQSCKRLSGMPGFHHMYGTFLFEEGRKDEAVREFERLAKETADDRAARTRLVTVYRSVNRVADAERVLSDALKKNAKDLDALLQQGEMFLEERKYDPAEADLNQVVRLQPGSAEVHYILGKLYQARGSESRYKQEMAKALELSPHLLPVRLEFAQSLLTGNNAQAALDVLNAAPESQKQSIPVLVERNWALWTLGDLGEMRKGIDLGLSRVRSTDLLIQDALWKLRASDYPGARRVLEEALKLNPADLRALKALRDTYIAQKEAPMALQKVKEYAAQQPKSAPIQDFLGVLLMAQGSLTEAREALVKAKTADARYVKADLALAQLDVLQGKMDDARNRLSSVVSANGSNITAELWLGNIAEMKGDHAAAIKHFRAVVDANPGNAQALNNLAYLLAEYANKPDEALKYAEQAVQTVPDSPAYCDTLGWILYRKGIYASAVGYLERASSAKENVVWTYHLAMAYAKAGDFRKGHDTFEVAHKRNPNVPEAGLAQKVLDQFK